MSRKPLYPHIPKSSISPELETLIKSLGFKNVADFKQYMKSKARLNEYGAVCYTEKRQGYTLNYSDNCYPKPGQFGIGGNVKGTFRDYRFN
jgi:hypothetical protein